MLALSVNTAGEIELSPGESTAATRNLLRQIAARHDLQIRVWTDAGKVYFSLVAQL